jgi:AcrR family transcriptional regulator
MDDTPKRKSRKTRPALSADRIAAEAMALCDEAGFDAVSFRALGKRLGCEAMSLYHYFPSKQHLVDAMVNTCLAETPVPSPGPPARERMRALCHAYRATAVRHAGFAPILFTHRLNHREGLAWLDEVAGIFDDTRADDLRRATVFRVISYYLTGASLDEALGYARGPSAANPVPGDVAQRDFPRILALGAYFGKAYHDPFFDAGLDLLMDWMEREL